MSWTDEAIELLKKLWAEGLSASMIAARLPGTISRNAVIGKRIRLGLPDRASSVRQNNVRRARRTAAPRPSSNKPEPTRVSTMTGIWAKSGSADPEPLPKGDNPDDFPNLVALIDLEPHQCRWPIGDPKQGRFGFCGGKKVEGLPYCEGHCRRAYQPPATQRSRKAKDKVDVVKARRHDREEVV